jgi:hypothetical protein
MSEIEVDSEAKAARAMRAMEISGRRLCRLRDGRWGVYPANDRRRQPVVSLHPETVKRLVEAGRLTPAGEETFVLTSVTAPRWIPLPPRALFMAAHARRPSRVSGGVGFAGLAMMARSGAGPLSMRQVLAGLRLVADAERAAADPRMTMNWDAGPVTRQRRGASAGGRTGDAKLAARLLDRLRSKIGETNWRLAWMLCVEAEPLATLKRRFTIAQRDIHARVQVTLEHLAAAYDG